MSLLWIDGFEAYGAPGANAYKAMRRAGYYMALPFGGSTNPTITSFTRRGIGLALLPNTWNYNGGPQVQIKPSDKVIAGLAVCVPTPLMNPPNLVLTPTNWGGTTVLSFNISNPLSSLVDGRESYDDHEIGKYFQALTVNIGSDFSVAISDNLSQVVPSAPGVITPGLWQYLECALDTVNNTVEIRVDGSTVLRAPFVTHVKPINSVVINVAGSFGLGFLAVDDFYICNGEGASFNDFLGDVVVHAIYPFDEGYVVNTENIVGGPSAHAALLANKPGGTSNFITTGHNDGDTVLFTPQTFPPDFIDVLAVEVCAQFPQGNIAPLPAASPTVNPGGTAIVEVLPVMGGGSGGGSGAGGGGLITPVITTSGSPPTATTGDAPAYGVTPFDLALLQNDYSALIGQAVRVNPTPDGDAYVVAKLLTTAMPEGGPWTTENAQGVQFGVAFGSPTSGQVDFSAIYLNCLATYSPDYGFIDVILDDVFPNDISYESVGSTRFATDVIVVDSGADQRVQRWDQPLMEYDVGYGVRTMEQLQGLIAFFRVMRGRKNAFNYLDHVDHTSSVATGYEARRAPPVTPFDQPVGTGNGTNKTFQLTKTYSSQSQTQVRPIYRAVPGTVRMGVGGKEVTAFTVDAQGRVTFTSALTVTTKGTVVTGGSNGDAVRITGQPGDFSALAPFLAARWGVSTSGFTQPAMNMDAAQYNYLWQIAQDGSWLEIAIPHSYPTTVETTTGSVSVSLSPAPPPNLAVTAGFQFYVPVRFDTDTLPITLHEYGVGGANSVKLIEVRPSSWGS